MNNLLPSYEIWGWIKGYEGRFEISNRGRIRSWIKNSGVRGRIGFLKKPLIKKAFPNCHGYYQTSIGNESMNDVRQISIHRLVAIMFNKNTNNQPEVDHINGKKWCNEWWNFDWVDRMESIKRAFETGLINPALGEQQSNTKLTNEAVLLIYRHNAKTKKIADGFGISTHAVLDIKRGRTWWHITGHPRHIKPSEKGKYKKT